MVRVAQRTEREVDGTIETAITAIKLGAYDYLAKPYRMAEIDVLVRRAWEKRQLSKENALLLKELIEAGRFQPVIDRTYPLEDVVEATQYVETGQKTGNVVLTV